MATEARSSQLDPSVRAYLFSRVVLTILIAAAAVVLVLGWGWQPGWVVAAIAVLLAVDAVWRCKRRPGAALAPLFAFDVTIVSILVLAIDLRVAILIAPHAYMLTAAILVLPRREGLIIAGYLASWWVAILFGLVDLVEVDLSVRQEQLVLGSTALIYLSSMYVLLSMAAAGARESRSLTARLSHSEVQLEAVVSGAPVVLFAIDKEGIFTLSEGAGLAVLGLEPGQVVGMSVWDVYAEFPTVIEVIRGTLDGIPAEGQILELPEASFEIRITPQRDAEGQVTGIVGVGVDVTAKLGAERELQRIQAEDQLMASISARAVALPGGDGRSVMAEFGRVADHLGCELAFIVSGRESEGRHAYKWRAARPIGSGDEIEVGEVELPWLEDRVAGQGSFSLSDPTELPDIAQDEQAFCAAHQVGSLLAVPLTQTGPNHGYAIVGSEQAGREWCAEDVMTVRRGAVMLSNVLDRMRAQHRLEALVRSKDEFVASVSHELRTPLSSIVGLSELLRDEPGWLSPAEIEEFHGSIAEEAGELAAIVEDLLVVARADIDAVSVLPESVSLDEEIDYVIQSVRVDDRDRIQVVDGGLEAWADRGRVRQVLRNLVTNAVRYGGPYIEVRSTTEDDRCVIDVCDDGERLSPVDSKRIFEPYEQAGAVPGRPGSIGLGLTVSRKLCRLMNGDLEYLRINDRNVFRVTIPSNKVPVVRAPAS